MASRPIWRGHLRLALVTCPIALHSVVRASGDLHFHYINPKTGNRVRMVTLDAETDDEVSRRDLVKGYEFEKDRYVLLDDEDFEQAKIESFVHVDGGQVRRTGRDRADLFRHELLHGAGWRGGAGRLCRAARCDRASRDRLHCRAW